jgi:hypothetical protein
LRRRKKIIREAISMKEMMRMIIIRDMRLSMLEAILMLIIVSPRVVSLLNRNKRKGIKIENLLLGRRVTLMMIKNFK